MVTMIRVKLVDLRLKSSGDVGGLFIQGMLACPVGSVRVPEEIIQGHGGLWSDNSVAMLAALFRIQFSDHGGGKGGSTAIAPRSKYPGISTVKKD
jgi:hypothetical protein